MILRSSLLAFLLTIGACVTPSHRLANTEWRLYLSLFADGGIYAWELATIE